ncbi:MAG: GerMN domain-containing protein, partial [Thermoflexales bacterium]|nr:GerMN domain-containing protein [Thermoflexales bacterium]
MHSRSFPRGLIIAAGVTLLLAFTLIVTTAAAQRDEPQSASPANLICFAVDYTVACVERPALNASGPLTDQIRALIEAMLLGPTASEQAQGLRSALPAETKLVAVRVIDRHTTIDLAVPQSFLNQLTDLQAEAINQQFNATLMPYNFTWLAVNARDTSGNLRL